MKTLERSTGVEEAALRLYIETGRLGASAPLCVRMAKGNSLPRVV